MLINKIEGSTTIISLVPEGSRVNGPAVADFDGVVEFVDVDSESHKTVRLVGDDGKEKTYDITIGPFTELLVTDRMKIRKGDFIAGDVLCELDSSALVEKEKEQQIKLTTARANLEKLRRTSRYKSPQTKAMSPKPNSPKNLLSWTSKSTPLTEVSISRPWRRAGGYQEVRRRSRVE